MQTIKYKFWTYERPATIPAVFDVNPSGMGFEFYCLPGDLATVQAALVASDLKPMPPYWADVTDVGTYKQNTYPYYLTD